MELGGFLKNIEIITLNGRNTYLHGANAPCSIILSLIDVFVEFAMLEENQMKKSNI